MTSIPQEQNIYIEIRSSTNFIIEEIHAYNLLEAWVYHTKWEYNWREVIIFDHEKNSCIPEVKFIDSFVWWKQTVPFSWMKWFIIIWLIALVFWYFYFTKEDPGSEKNEVSLFPSAPTLVENETSSWILDSPVVSSIDPRDTQISSLESEVNLLNSRVEEFKNIENTLKIRSISCQWEVSLLNNQIDFLNQMKGNELKRNTSFEWQLDNIQEKLNICNSEKDNLLQKNQSLKSTILSENQLFLKLWKDVFNRCKTKESEYCTEYIYNTIE